MSFNRMCIIHSSGDFSFPVYYICIVNPLIFILLPLLLMKFKMLNDVS